MVKNWLFKSYYLFHHIFLKKTLHCNQIDLGVYYRIVHDSILWRGVGEEILRLELSPWSILKIVCQLGYDWHPIGTQLAPNWPPFTTKWVKSKRGHIKSDFNCHLICVSISKFLTIGWLAHRGEVHDRLLVNLYTISHTNLN